jgi:hypothetical protein
MCTDMTLWSYRHIWTIALLCSGILVTAAPEIMLAAGVVGNGTAASCTDAALDAALAGGGLVTFNCGGPAFIDISGKTIAANTTVDGDGVITLNGGFPAFNIDSGVEFAVHGVRIAAGSGGIFAQDGGALMVTDSEFIGITNDINASRFAGHSDWQIPTIARDGGTMQLETIIDTSVAGCGSGAPCVAPAFNTGCMAGCTATSCSCTEAERYWSSTAIVGNLPFPSAWGVFFFTGEVTGIDKASAFFVRAVRNGS